MADGAFIQIGAILGLALAAGLLAKLLKQPVIVFYIAAGVLAGPSVLDFVTEDATIELLAQMGIAMLLFLVGLKLDIHLIRSIGAVALIAGVGQVVLTGLLGYLVALGLGWNGSSALYIAVAVMFSSTIIVVKVLGDRQELDQLHGRIAIGILIVQDIIVVAAMLVIVALGNPGHNPASIEIALTFGAGVLFLAATWAVSRFILPRLLEWMARSPELTLVFGVGWATTLASASQALGLSLEIGAFIAGLTLASSPYRESVGARLVALRDVMVLFFFIDLGASLNLEGTYNQLIPALVLSALVLIGKPLLVMALMTLMRYRPAVGLRAGISVAQISEFSLILVALGLGLGQIGQDVVSLVTLVMIFTITISTYFIDFQDALVAAVSPLFHRLSSQVGDDTEREATTPYDAIVIDAGRLGSGIITGLVGNGSTLLVVDLDPRALKAVRAAGVDTLYGDASDPDFIGALPTHETKTVVCAVPERVTNIVVRDTLQRLKFAGKICVTAMDSRSADDFSGDPQVTVIRPHHIAAHTVVKKLADNVRPRDTGAV